MTRSAPPQRSFSSGEVTPLLAGRTDYQRHQTGLRLCRGGIPLKHGGVTRAPGSRYDGRTRGDAAGRLIAFEFATGDAVVLEFTPGWMRVWRYGELVMVGSQPFQLATPYDAAAIPRLKYVQTADVIYLADGVAPPQKLSRFALDNWTIAPLVAQGGPLRAPNGDEGMTVIASAQTGTVTLTASGALFEAGHVGALFQMRVTDWTGTPIWTGNTTVVQGARMRFDGQVYEVIDEAGGNTGVNPPVHRRGVALSQSGGISWRHVGTDAGLVRITAVASPTSASATVIDRIPSELVAAGTYLWSEGAWSARLGWPSCVALFDQRLVFAATPSEPRAIWFSTVGAFEDFSVGDPDQGISYAIDASGGVNRIVWLQPGGRALHVGAEGEVHSSRSTQSLEVVTATNIAFGLDVSIGCADVQPIAPDGRPIFIDRARARVHQLSYRLEADRIDALDLTLPAEHFGAARFQRVAWQSAPLRLGWFTRADGVLAVMVFDPDEEVLGWATVPVAGGFVEDVAVTPGADADDDVTLIVRREIGGQTRRHVERLTPFYGVLTDPGISIAQAEHAYAGVRVTLPAPGATFEGLAHLEGQSVIAWTDRGQFGPHVVSGGQIVIDGQATTAFIGLEDDTHEWGTLDLYAGVRDGDGLGRPQKVTRCGVRLHRTAAYRVRDRARRFGVADVVNRWITRRGDGVPGDLVTGFSGVDFVEGLGLGWSPTVALDFAPVGLAPFTLLAITPQVEAQA